MDRKAFTACAAGCLLLACAVGIAWNAPIAAVVGVVPQVAPPALLDAEALGDCSCRSLDQNVVESPRSVAGRATSGHEPVISAAEPLNPLRLAQAPAPRKRPVLSPVPTPTQLAVPAGQANDEPQAVTPEAEAEADPIDTAEDSGPMHTPLPWAHANPRSPEMLAVAKRAEQRVRYGFQLARRGAVYSARAEFISGLQIIAEGNDAQRETRLYGKALSAGLTALREASVFVRHPADRPDVDVDRIVAAHRTPVLKDAESALISPTAAAQRYYTYAQEQLAAAAASEVSGSMALFGLAKVTADIPGNATQSMERTSQAIAYYQAALLAEPRNYLAANELGVLELATGNLPRARDLFIHSVNLVPQPCAWQNLVVVHTRLGERHLAEQAKERLAACPHGNEGNQRLAVEWLDPSVFANTSPLTEGLAASPAPKKAPTAQPAAKPVSGTEPTGTSKRGLADLLPWNSRH